MPKLCISAASGSGGKTLLSLGLGRYFSNCGLVVQPFKKGPDYIDAAWLSAACKTPCSNLDPFFQNPAGLVETFQAAISKSIGRGKNALVIVEGNRGLYDGLDETGSCSTAALARILEMPILLCLNAAKSTRTIAALAQGLLNFEKGLHFCGIILNNVGSSRHGQALEKALATNTGLPLLGMLPRLARTPLPERHMGLATRNAAIDDKNEQIFEDLAKLVAENCDTDRILELCQTFCERGSSENEEDNTASAHATGVTHENTPHAKHSDFRGVSEKAGAAKQGRAPVIGYVRDAAFWFYYPENLEALERAGVRLEELSLLGVDSQVGKWQNLDGLYLGGGFPEDYADQLSRSPLLPFIKHKAEQGLPIYAECGGLALLCRTLRTNDGVYPMANLFDIAISLHEKPQGLGYVEGEIIGPNPFFPIGHRLRGHEFHYTSCETDAELPRALLLNRGQGLAKNGRDALVYKNVWASYIHIFAPSQPCWAVNFAAIAETWQKRP